MTPLLDARGLAISGRLQPTDLKLDPGMTAVIGPNGAGKTSLLRALAGIELETGDVLIAGEDLTHAPPPRRMRLLSSSPPRAPWSGRYLRGTSLRSDCHRPSPRVWMSC